MARKWLLAAAAVTAAMALGLAGSCGCGNGGSGSTPDSGITGAVTIGPISPVEQPGQPNEKPYAATIVVKRANGGIAATVRSGQDGRFSVALPPGDYVLEPQNGSPLPVAPTQPVTVQPHQFATVRVQYDSGIR